MNLNSFFEILTVKEVVSFGKAQRNRQVSKSHANDFFTIIKNTKFEKDDDGTYLVFGPIPLIANRLTGNLMDGQHKQEALKRAYEEGILDDNARVLVGYWDTPDLDEENRIIVMLNTNSKNWTLNDYVESYAKYNENYKRLIDFCASHSLCQKMSPKGPQYKPRYAAAMITGKGGQAVLASGNFSFTEEQFEEADKIHGELMTIRQKLNLPLVGPDIEDMACEWHRNRNFITAKQIKNLYIPAAIRNMMSIRTRKDWKFVFNTLRANIQDLEYKASVA